MVLINKEKIWIEEKEIKIGEREIEERKICSLERKEGVKNINKGENMKDFKVSSSKKDKSSF